MTIKSKCISWPDSAFCYIAKNMSVLLAVIMILSSLVLADGLPAAQSEAA